MAGTTTMEDYKKKVLGLNLASAADHELYIKLLALAPAFKAASDYSNQLSAMGTLAAGAVSGIWTAAAIILATALLLVTSSTGTGWWLAAGDRDTARAALVQEQGVSAALRASITEQNRAIDGMAKATLAAQERGAVAQAAAATKGKKYDAAQAQIAGARATTCDEAMPAVRLLLEGVR